MVKEEIWSIPIQRAQSFFRQQSDVTEEHANIYCLGNCHVTLTDLGSHGTGFWVTQRIRIRFEGEDADVNALHHRFFIHFLSTGG